MQRIHSFTRGEHAMTWWHSADAGAIMRTPNDKGNSEAVPTQIHYN
jgi:hypothetical protein